MSRARAQPCRCRVHSAPSPWKWTYRVRLITAAIGAFVIHPPLQKWLHLIPISSAYLRPREASVEVTRRAAWNLFPNHGEFYWKAMSLPGSSLPRADILAPSRPFPPWLRSAFTFVRLFSPSYSPCAAALLLFPPRYPVLSLFIFLLNFSSLSSTTTPPPPVSSCL